MSIGVVHEVSEGRGQRVLDRIYSGFRKLERTCPGGILGVQEAGAMRGGGVTRGDR